MLSLNGSAELSRLNSQRRQQQQPAGDGASAADRVLRAAQRAVDSALGSRGETRQPESEEALRTRWAAALQDEDEQRQQPATPAIDVRASQGSTTLDDQFYLLPASAAQELAGSSAAAELRSSGRIPDKLVWKRPPPGAVFSDVVDVLARTIDDITDGVTDAGDAAELADEGIATMTLRGAGSGLRQGAACESPPQRLGEEEAEEERADFGEAGTKGQQPQQQSAGDVADCRRLLASRKVGSAVGGGSGGRVVHPRVLPPQQQQQQVAATAAATAAVAMAEPLIRGQQQVEANINRLLERLERLESERAASTGGQQQQQLEERRLREQLDRLLADRLGQLELLQREQLRMQQELLIQHHHMPMVPVLPPPPPPPPPPTQRQQQFLRQLVDERAASDRGSQRRPAAAGESTRKSPGPPPAAESQPPSVARAAQVVSDIRDEVRAIVRRGDNELGGGVARLLNEIDSIRSDIRAHKDRYQALPQAEAAGSGTGRSRPTSMLPQFQSSPAVSAIEAPADRSTPAVSLSGLSRFEINGAGSGGAGAEAAPGKKRRSYPLNEYLRRDPLPDRSVYPSYDSVLEAERRQRETVGREPEDSVAAAQRTLREVRRRQKALETRAQTAERSRDGKLIYSIVDAIWRDEEAAQRARVRAVVDDVIKHGGAYRQQQQAAPGARRTRTQPPEEPSLPIRAIFDAASDAELARLCTPQKGQGAPGSQRPKLGPWQRMPYMHFANDVKGPITAYPGRPAEEPPRRRAVPTGARPAERREPRPPPRTREEAVQAGSPPRDSSPDSDGGEDAVSVEGAGVKLPGYQRAPARRPQPPRSSQRRPSAEDAAAASQPAGRVRSDRTADAIRSRMRDEVMAEVLTRMAERRRRPADAPAEPHNSAGLEALIRRMVLSALLARVDRAVRRVAGRDVQPPAGAACSTPEFTPRDDEELPFASQSTPTPPPAPPAAEPSMPLSALQLLLQQQRPEPPPPPQPPQPLPRASAASPDSELSGSEDGRQHTPDAASLPSRHSVRTPTPSLEEPSAASPPPPPIAQSSRLDTACQTLQDAVSQTAADAEAQTTLREARSPPAAEAPEVPPSATPSTPSSPATPTCADSISEGVWLLDRSEGQAPNIQVAAEARQLLGELDASNGDANFDLTADLSLADPPTRSEGEFPRRAPGHRPDPRRDPVLQVIAGSDGRPLYPPPPGRRRPRSEAAAVAAAAAAAAAAADYADSSAGSSLSEPAGPDLGDDVTDVIADDDDDDGELPPTPPPQQPQPPAAMPSRPPAAPSSSPARPAPASLGRAGLPEEPLRPSQSPPAQRESLRLRDSADDGTALASTAEFRTEATDRPEVDPEAYLGLSSTATNLLSTNQAIQDAFAATADSASLGNTGPRRLTVNVPGLDTVAGSSPDEGDSVSEISLGGGL